MSRRKQTFNGEVSGYVAGRDMHVYAGVILDHWDMWSSRNSGVGRGGGGFILDHWDMWSSRNSAVAMIVLDQILDHWDMWSSRNLL